MRCGMQARAATRFAPALRLQARLLNIDATLMRMLPGEQQQQQQQACHGSGSAEGARRVLEGR
jgi:hypothetical protein